MLIIGLENTLLRFAILSSTTAASSGHPTSSLSAVELAAVLFFAGFFKYDLKNPKNIFNDRIIFSKGHAAPLLYALYYVAGILTYQEILNLRKFDSVLEGHPTPRFPFIDVATGSLGQGLSLGIGIALGLRLKIKKQPNVFVFLGDSEVAEGQIWEAAEIASYYKINNLIGILDMNRLGQSTETMTGWDEKTYRARFSSFGWRIINIDDGHNLEKIYRAFKIIKEKPTNKPTIIIAKTIKGKGVSFLEDKVGWHGKALSPDLLDKALKEIGDVNKNIRGKINPPQASQLIEMRRSSTKTFYFPPYALHDLVATREAYGQTLLILAEKVVNLIVLDAEVFNSEYEEEFSKKYPHRFFQMFIAEQNLISTALGLAKTGFIPFSATFAAFLTRAFDQLRMSQYSLTNETFIIVGSHAGVSIGQDGPSQMGLEDLSMARSILPSIVFYPCDAVSTCKIMQIMIQNKGFFYLRTTRGKTPVIYPNNEKFKIGGLKILKQSRKDRAVVIAAGITLHEALKAYEKLKKKGINIAVVDLYCVKPIDADALKKLAKRVRQFIVVEDHYPCGGIGEAVKAVLSNEKVVVHHLAVNKIPRSGSPAELLRFEEIDDQAIMKKVNQLANVQ